ncbi:signal peptidase II [Paenibacillus senegalensis]|uniref:signal peptidase II n=1 Tax=Paenibacillus senegalensis TaxID=1465766 RepID=UPI0002894913|nr:signal peptidase II [Paenibacillus senegalensis]
MIYYLIAIIVIALDQFTKRLIVNNMELGDTIPVLGDFFQITSHRNTGAAFGILEGQRWFFIVTTTVVVVAIIIYMTRLLKEKKKFLPFALALLLGGAIGNFIDRLLFGEVVDFLKFRFQFNWFGQWVDYTFAIFNVADAAIVVGVFLVIAESFISWRREQKALKGGGPLGEQAEEEGGMK